MRFRVDGLAARSGVSVDTVRFYQSRGLLPPPRREGRVAWYDDEHLERLARIRRLQARGLTLATIARRHHEAMRQVAERAVELFDTHVRHPLRDSGLAEDDAAARLVEAFTTLL